MADRAKVTSVVHFWSQRLYSWSDFLKGRNCLVRQQYNAICLFEGKNSDMNRTIRDQITTGASEFCHCYYYAVENALIFCLELISSYAFMVFANASRCNFPLYIIYFIYILFLVIKTISKQNILYQSLRMEKRYDLIVLKIKSWLFGLLSNDQSERSWIWENCVK